MNCDLGHEARDVKRAPLPNGSSGYFCPEHWRPGSFYSQIAYALRRAGEQRRKGRPWLQDARWWIMAAKRARLQMH